GSSLEGREDRSLLGARKTTLSRAPSSSDAHVHSYETWCRTQIPKDVVALAVLLVLGGPSRSAGKQNSIPVAQVVPQLVTPLKTTSNSLGGRFWKFLCTHSQVVSPLLT
ncbi:unnamed protein product, partial [Ixodes pacificus]